MRTRSVKGKAAEDDAGREFIIIREAPAFFQDFSKSLQIAFNISGGLQITRHLMQIPPVRPLSLEKQLAL